MPDYQKMYLELFNDMTALIEKMKEIQRKTEEMYIESTCNRIQKQQKKDVEKLDIFF